MRTSFLFVISVIASLQMLSCGKKTSDSTASVSPKLRSMGQSTSLTGLVGGEEVQAYLQRQAANLTGNTSISNSSVNITSYTVPIGRITMAQGLAGTGYTNGSDIYVCPGTTDDSCRVDLSKAISVDNLLSGPGAQSVATGTYDGIAVEFCFVHSSTVEGTGKGYFDVKLTATVVINSTTYYTNATSGLSSTGPAAEITVRLKGSGCGVTTALVSPITLNKGDTTTVTLYADPNGSLVGTDTQSQFSNIACSGSDPASICAQPVAVYATNDTATPTIERYNLKFSDSSSTTYSSGLLSVLFNSSGQAIGAMAANVFKNVSSTRALNGNFNFMSVKTNADSTLTFQAYNTNGTALVDIISSLNRKGTSTGTISNLVSSSLTWTATKQ